MFLSHVSSYLFGQSLRYSLSYNRAAKLFRKDVKSSPKGRMTGGGGGRRTNGRQRG